MQKHAFLIMAHNDFELLKVLILMLDDARNDIYLHVDKKVSSFRSKEWKTSHAGLFILDQRLDVRWGHMSQIRLEMLLFETAYSNGPYAYYHLLSGVDLPIKSQDYIHEFFTSHQGKEFVGFWHNNDVQALDRVSHYYFFMRYERITNRFLSIFMAKFRNVLVYILPKRRIEVTYKKGPNWVSITHDFCGYLLSKKNWILNRFRYTRNCDEVFLQTILWNSSFRDNLYDPIDVDNGCMREIDWERGSFASPYIWRSEDEVILRESSKLFARKFSTSVDSEIISRLYHLFSV